MASQGIPKALPGTTAIPPLSDTKSIAGSSSVSAFQDPKAILRRDSVAAITQIAQKSKLRNSFSQATPFTLKQPPVSSKPPPIQNTSRVPSRVSFEMPKETVLKGKNLREDVLALTRALDANIASAVPAYPLSMTVEERSASNMRILEFHNYTFNELILMEKSTCSDRAILLRRLQTFYNQMIKDIPKTIDDIMTRESGASSQYSDLEAKYEQARSECESEKRKNEELESKMKELTEELARLTESSNQQDLVISSKTFDLDYAQGQVNQLKYKLLAKKRKNKSLKQAVADRDAEVVRQLEQLDAALKQVEQYQQGETGYIVMYHDVQAKLHEAQSKIDALEQKIYRMENKETMDVSVDTSDLPVTTKKKKKISSSMSSTESLLEKRRSLSRMASNALFPTYQESARGSSKSSALPSARQNKLSSADHLASGSTKSLMRGFLPQPMDKNLVVPGINLTSSMTSMMFGQPIPTLVAVETQTSPREQQEEPKMEPEPEVVEEEPEIVEEIITVEEATSIDQIKFNESYGSSMDEQLISQLPDLLEIVIPYMGHPYSLPIPQELAMICTGITTNIVKNDKPLIWGLRIIHNFMQDPNVRSLENQHKTSIESIFLDWMKAQFQVRHVINQNIADFVDVMIKYQEEDELIRLFFHILEGQFTMAQICFICVLYTFTVQFTHPNLNDMLANLSAEIQQPKIHVLCAVRILEKCFTPDMAFRCLKKEIDPDKPMIRYTTFLRAAVVFFGKNQKILSSQTKDLMTICGGASLIGYDSFSKFMNMLDMFDTRAEWKVLMSKQLEKSAASVKFADVLTLCAEKRTPFIKLLNLVPLEEPVRRLQTMSQQVKDIFNTMLERYVKLKPQVYTRLSDVEIERISCHVENMRSSILLADIPMILFHYKKILMELDHITLDRRGYIPFQYSATAASIEDITKYFNKAEKVSFALLDERELKTVNTLVL